MNENIYGNISVECICREFYLGKTAASTKFKQETGKSIIEYYNHLKVTKAIDLMYRTNMNVTEISEALSFSSSQYFSRVFKKHTGVVPSMYKYEIKINKLRRIISK